MLKYAYLIDVAIPSQPSQRRHRQTQEAYRIEKRAYKKMTTENSRYNTNIRCYYSKTCLKRTPYIPETWTNGK